MAEEEKSRRSIVLRVTSRASSWIVFSLGFLVFLPGLVSPYWLDDYVHKSMVRGTFPSPRSPFDLYNFVTDGDRKLLIDRGVLPWWTHPHLTIRFFRPLSSVLRWIDLTLTDNPIVQHAHSFLWWVVAVIGARSLYRESLSKRGAWIATFVFALAPCHAVPLSWLANREVLVSIAFGTFALAALARFLRRGARRDALVATLLFSIAMLAGEYSLAFGGYVFAFAIFLGAHGRRLSGLVTFGVPAGVTLALRAALGFGNAGSGFYRDPFTQTDAFFEAAPRRIARMVVDGWLASDSDWVMDVRWWLLALFAFVMIVLVSIPVRRAIAASTDDDARMARALIFGSLLALVPMVAVLPSPRLLGVAMIGVAHAVALALDHAWFPADASAPPKNDFASVVVLMLGFMHLVHGPVTSFLGTRFFRERSYNFVERNAWLRERTGPDPLDSDIVVARTGWQTVLFSPFALDDSGRLPRGWRVLSLVAHALMVRRGERSIELIVPRGRGYLPTGPDDLFRSADLPLHAGDEIDVPGLRVKVIETSDAGPGRVRFDFDRKLESIVWIADGKDAWKDVPPPQLGFGMPLDP